MRGFILNQYTREVLGLGPSRYEVFTKPSVTVPGEALSLQDILHRYSRTGNLNTTVFDPVYLGDDTMVPDNLEAMTPMDRLDLAADLKQAVADKQVEMSQRQRKREDDAAVKAALAQREADASKGEAAPPQVDTVPPK